MDATPTPEEPEGELEEARRLAAECQGVYQTLSLLIRASIGIGKAIDLNKLREGAQLINQHRRRVMFLLSEIKHRTDLGEIMKELYTEEIGDLLDEVLRQEETLNDALGALEPPQK